MVIIVFNELKSEAKTNVLKNYKYLFLPILLHEIFSSLAIGIFDVGFLKNYSFLVSLILITMLIIIKFVFLPITVIIYFKIGIYILDKKKFHLPEVVRFLNCNNILKIAATSFVPNIIDFSYSLFKYFKAEFNSFLLYYLLIFIFLTIGYYAEYKFFICNYSLIVMCSSPKEILNFSFKTMKHKIADYIKYDISFVSWYLIVLIIGIIGVFILSLMNIEVTHFRFAISSGFGIMFFYRPYRFFSNLLYAKYLTENRKHNFVS